MTNEEDIHSLPLAEKVPFTHFLSDPRSNMFAAGVKKRHAKIKPCLASHYDREFRHIAKGPSLNALQVDCGKLIFLEPFRHTMHSVNTSFGTHPPLPVDRNPDGRGPGSDHFLNAILHH